MCSGATQPTFEEGHVLSPVMAFQWTMNDKGKEGSSTRCTLEQSVRLWASWEHNQQAKRRGLSALVGRIWPQVIRSCEIAGRRKGEEEEKGDLFDLLSAVLGLNSLLTPGTEEVAPSPF